MNLKFGYVREDIGVKSFLYDNIKKDEYEKDNEVLYYLIKDFWPEQDINHKKYIKSQGFKEFAVYQRMLYAMIFAAVKQNLSNINFGRTAEELMSTWGASPVSMKLYVRLRSKLSNRLLKPIISTIKPNEFEIRNPFKVAFNFA